MKINKQEVEYIAKLAKLNFTEKEIEKLSGEFDAILNHFDNLNQEELEGVPIYDFKDKVSVLRQDSMRIFEDKEDLFMNAKKMQGLYIEIPKIIE